MPSAYPAAIPRRIVMVILIWLGFALVLVLTPLLLLVSVAADLVLRRPGWPTTRMAVFLFVAFWIEVTSEVRVLWALLIHPFTRQDWTHMNHQLMHWWVGRLAKGAERVVGLRLQVDVPDDLRPGPYLTFAQHVSIVDAIAPAYLLGTVRGWYVRYTLARGLRVGPCLDIVGHRIPNHFVARGASDNTRELATMRTLVADMEDDELAVIFPGGGLFTPTGLTRAVEKLRERGSPEAEAAAAYRHVLPPRPGGVQAFFDGAPTANVLVVGHVGFEPVASIKKLWEVLPLSDPVEVRFWRYDRAEVPPGEAERLAWLYEKWAVMDEWIDDRLRQRAGLDRVPA
jgi:hypothetical protein